MTDSQPQDLSILDATIPQAAPPQVTVSPTTDTPATIRAEDIAFGPVSPGVEPDFRFKGYADLSGGAAAPSANSNKKKLLEILDSTHLALTQNTQTLDSLRVLTRFLTSLRNKVDVDDWKHLIQDIILPHPITKTIHKEPCTFRAFSKPRGYAGDAVMLDYLYRKKICNSPDPLTQNIAKFVVESDAASSVRSRLQILSQKIQKKLTENPNLKILSIACGHCIEYELVDQDILKNSNADLTALDSDRKSLDYISYSTCFVNKNILHTSLLDILSGKIKLKGFDFIYSLGIYDYLNNRIASRLSKKLVDGLTTKGELLIANFANTTRDVGYMEGFMAWDLIYRTPEQMLKIIPSLFSDCVKSITLTPDETGQIIMTSIIKG